MNLLSGGCVAVPTDGRMLQRRAGPRHRHYNQQCERPARLREHGPGQGAPGQHRQPAQLPDFRRLAALPRRHPSRLTGVALGADLPEDSVDTGGGYNIYLPNTLKMDYGFRYRYNNQAEIK